MAKIKEHFKQNWWKYVIILFVVGIDMLTKFLLVPLNSSNEVDNSRAIKQSLLGEVLWLWPETNTGAGFSMLSGQTIFLIVITFLFLIALAVYDIVLKPQKSKLYNTAVALVAGGAVGNLFDRLAFGGKVRDFIYFKFINFPIFNVADMALTFGIICLIVWFIFFELKKSKQEQNSQKVAENGQNLAKNEQETDDFSRNQSDINKNQGDGDGQK